jgi:hypothetical protein
MQRWPQLRFQEPVRTGNEKCRREISTSRSRRQDINVRCASKAVSLTDSATACEFRSRTRTLFGRGADNPLLGGSRGFRTIRGGRNYMNDLVATAF